MELASPLSGVVAEIVAGEGDPVAAGDPVLLVESMKMHHELPAPIDGIVRELGVAIGDQVSEGQVVGRVEAATVEPTARKVPGTFLAWTEAMERRARTLDEARPAAVERMHARGRRTVRENLADLCDEGTFVEYGALTLAAQRARRSLEQLIEQTPGDGIVTGVGDVG